MTKQTTQSQKIEGMVLSVTFTRLYIWLRLHSLILLFWVWYCLIWFSVN